jgi:seryl-tRNA synthetase
MQMIADGKGDDKEGGSRRSTIGLNSQCGEWQGERGRERERERERESECVHACV